MDTLLKVVRLGDALEGGSTSRLGHERGLWCRSIVARLMAALEINSNPAGFPPQVELSANQIFQLTKRLRTNRERKTSAAEVKPKISNAGSPNSSPKPLIGREGVLVGVGVEGSGVEVGLGGELGVALGTGEEVLVGPGGEVFVGVGVLLLVGVGVGVSDTAGAVFDGVGVNVFVGVGVKVFVGVGVKVSVGVGVSVGSA